MNERARDYYNAAVQYHDHGFYALAFFFINYSLFYAHLSQVPSMVRRTIIAKAIIEKSISRVTK